MAPLKLFVDAKIVFSMVYEPNLTATLAYGTNRHGLCWSMAAMTVRSPCCAGSLNSFLSAKIVFSVVSEPNLIAILAREASRYVRRASLVGSHDGEVAMMDRVFSWT